MAAPPRSRSTSSDDEETASMLGGARAAAADAGPLVERAVMADAGSPVEVAPPPAAEHKAPPDPPPHRETDPHPAFRGDVESMRGVAVAAVVVYHFFPQAFFGGFVGVDVFFAISGFVIGLMLTKWWETNSFSWAKFYATRSRRLLPASTVTIVVVAVTTAVTLDFFNATSILWDGVAASTFRANYHFWAESVEYGLERDLQSPFLHFWSLAVEEQFYVFFPFVIWLVVRWSRRWGLLLLTLSILASFGYSQWLLNNYETTLAFYDLRSRWWELAMGYIALEAHRSLASLPSAERWSSVLSSVGAVLVTASIAFSHITPVFPAAGALPSVLGTAMLLAAGEQGPVNSLLSENKLLRWLGSRSYSLYLVHWPVIVLGGQENPSVGAWMRALLIIALLATVMERIVERPFRRLARTKHGLLLGLACVALSLAACWGSLQGVHLPEYNGAAVEMPEFDTDDAALPNHEDALFPIDNSTINDNTASLPNATNHDDTWFPIDNSTVEDNDPWFPINSSTTDGNDTSPVPSASYSPSPVPSISPSPRPSVSPSPRPSISPSPRPSVSPSPRPSASRAPTYVSPGVLAYRAHIRVLTASLQATEFPSNLDPPLSDPRRDYAANVELAGCHGRECVFSVPANATFRSGKRMVLVGDSHTMHWFRPLLRVARRLGMEVRTRFLSSCPFGDQKMLEESIHDAACRAHNAAAIELAKTADLLVISRYVLEPPELAPALDRAMHRARVQARVNATTLSWYIGDPPSGTSPTELNKAQRPIVVEPRAHVVREDLTMAELNDEPGMFYTSTVPLFCVPGADGALSCPTIIGKYLPYLDSSHLTGPVGTYLSPVMEGFLEVEHLPLWRQLCQMTKARCFPDGA